LLSSAKDGSLSLNSAIPPEHGRRLLAGTKVLYLYTNSIDTHTHLGVASGYMYVQGGVKQPNFRLAK